MTFVQRKISVQITLAEDPSKVGQPRTFKESGTDTVTIADLRMSCKIAKAGGLSDSTMDLTIYGLTFSIMNQLSTLGLQINLLPRNRIVVTAGDDVSGMGTVFDGYILRAESSFENAPDNSFVIHAQVAAPYGVIPSIASSFPNSADVATIMSGFATLMGLKFENNGVTTKLPPSYFSGSVRSQAQAAVTAAGIAWIIDNGVLAIWPKNGFRGGQVPLINPKTGMIGYPIYTGYGIIIRTLFNPSIGFGQKIKVESQLEAASGEFSVYILEHALDTQMPHGKWESTVGGHNPKYPTPIPGGAR